VRVIRALFIALLLILPSLSHAVIETRLSLGVHTLGNEFAPPNVSEITNGQPDNMFNGMLEFIFLLDGPIWGVSMESSGVGQDFEDENGDTQSLTMAYKKTQMLAGYRFFTNPDGTFFTHADLYASFGMTHGIESSTLLNGTTTKRFGKISPSTGIYLNSVHQLGPVSLGLKLGYQTTVISGFTDQDGNSIANSSLDLSGSHVSFNLGFLL
jgi:hypothetical protein